MSKAVLISIRPKWCQLIDKGEKTVEVRKTFPNFKRLNTPFKCYIYCTQGMPSLLDVVYEGTDIYGTPAEKKIFIQMPEGGYGSGIQRKAVIGEFTCDCAGILNELFVDDEPHSPVYHLPYIGNCCMTLDEIEKYGKGKRLWGWHITDYKRYKEPKMLADFGLTRPPQDWCYVEEI